MTECAEDLLLPIAEERRRFFGGPGRMLCPAPATVAALLAEVPAGRVATGDLLAKTLARRFGVRGTCPVSLRKALQAAARQPGANAPFWRYVKSTGGLAALAGDAETQAARLIEEGLEIDRSGKAPRVRDYKKKLAQLA